MPVRNLKKLDPRILEAVLNSFDFSSQNAEGQALTISRLEKMTDEEMFVQYCEWHGLVNWGKSLLETIQSIRDSKIQPMWCYHMVPIGDSLLAALNSIPYNGQLVTVQDGQVVYRCET